jgi:ABC-type multidrug transport system fused ATPase/permease subunit
METKSLKTTLLTLLRPHRKKIIVGVIFAFLATLFSTASSYTLKILVDDVFIANKPKLLWPIQGVFIGLVFLNGFFTISKGKLFYSVGSSIIIRIRTFLFKTVSHADILKLSKNKTGDIISALSYDVDGLDGLVSDGISTLTTSFISILITIVVMFSLNFRLTLVTIPIIPILVIIFNYLNKKVGTLSKNTQKNRGVVTSNIEQLLTNIITVRSLGLADLLTDKFNDSTKTLQNSLANLKLLYLVLSLASWFLIMVPYQAIMYGVAGEWYFQSGVPSIGLMLAFANYANSMIGPVLSLIQLNRDYKYASTCWKRITDLVESIKSDTTSNPSYDDLPVQDFNHEITIKGLCFSYDSGKELFSNVSLTFDRNKLTAITGESGTGKSTLLRLIARLYLPDAGQVLYQGRDIRNFKPGEYHKKVIYIPQEPSIFHGTIRENLLLVNPDLQPEDMINALEEVSLADYIANKNNGLDTVLGPHGISLSGGEKQRLAIAQAILKDASVILLDEPTSALDAETERKLISTLSNLRKDHTILIVTHSPQVIENCNRIIQIQDLQQ